MLDLSVDGLGMPFLGELQLSRPSLPVIVISTGDEFQDRAKKDEILVMHEEDVLAVIES